MKKAKFYKSALSLLTATSILLMSGCTGGKRNQEQQEQQECCAHLTIYFDNEAITFKECDGYDIAYKGYGGGTINYTIKKGNEELIFGDTSQYNGYYVYHDVADGELDSEAIQKTRQYN